MGGGLFYLGSHLPPAEIQNFGFGPTSPATKFPSTQAGQDTWGERGILSVIAILRQSACSQLTWLLMSG
jgi:hypothetical protein